MATETWQEKLIRENEEADRILNGDVVEDATPEGGTPQDGSTVEASLHDKQQPSAESGIDLSAMLKTATTAGQKVEERKPEEQAQGADVNARLQAMEAELQRYRSEQGRTRVLADENKQLKEQLSEMQARLDKAREVKPHDGPINVFSDEEKEHMSPEFESMIGGRFAAVQKWQDDVNQKMKAIDSRIERAEVTTRNGEMEAMRRNLAARYPNLPAMVNGEAWSAYCNEMDPITKQLNGTLFANAVNTCDEAVACALIDRFVHASGFGNGHVSGGLQPSETGVTHTAQAVQGAPGKEIYRESDVMLFLKKVYSGKLSASDPAVRRTYEAYSAAINEGRVM